MIKKLLIKIAARAVIEILLGVALAQLEKVRTEPEKEKWRSIVNFLLEMAEKGLPL